MSVIPMKLLTIAGPLEQFDPVAAACVLDREFHPENALALMERVSGLRPLSAADLMPPPCTGPRSCWKPCTSPPPMPLLRTIRPSWTPSRPISDDLSGRLAELDEQCTRQSGLLDEDRDIARELEHLRSLSTELEPLWDLRYVRFPVRLAPPGDL